MKRSWLAVAAAAAQACSPATGPVPGRPVDVELSLHETEVVPGTALALTLDRVVGDSRCPVEVMCVWAGNAEVQVSATLPGNALEAHRLNSFLDPRVFEVGGYRVTFRRLFPEPREGAPIDSADYRLDLSVEGF